MAGAYGAKLLPVNEWDPLVGRTAAARLGERCGGGKVKGAEKGNGWVCERDNIGPGYVLVR
jgi:hypothetical protein